MSLRKLLVALLAIGVLAIALPYAAVSTLHQHRLTRAESELDALASAIRSDLRHAPAVNVLLGPGRVPKTTDARWQQGPTYPLDSALKDMRVTADPWGNGYVVNLGATGSESVVWLLSAGPDGTLQTPFDGSTSAPLGDDVGRRIR